MSITSGSTNQYTQINDIKNTIIYIGNTFVDDAHRTIFLGNLDTTSWDSKTNASQLNFVEALVMGYTSFKGRFQSSLPSSLPSDLLSQIMVRNLNSPVYRSADNSTFDPANTEINFSKLLTPNSDLLTYLDKIKNAYTFLQDNVLKIYSSGAPFKVSNYTIDSNNTSTLTVNSQNKSNFLGNIQTVIGDMTTFDYTNNDVFMIRRILLLYELLTNIYLSMYLYDIADNADATTKSNILSLISNTGNILINLNNNFIFTNDTGSSTRTNIVALMNTKAKAYKSSSDKIDQLDNQVRDLKLVLNNNMSLLNGGISRKSKAALYEKVMLGIFIASLFVIIAISVSPLPKATKLMVDGVILAILIISALMVDRLYRKKIEGFENVPEEKDEGFEDEGTETEKFEDEGTETEKFENEDAEKEGFVVSGGGVTDPNTTNAGQAVTDKVALLAQYDNSYKSNVLDYLSITIYLGLMLQSGRTYSSIDSAMKREITYFTQMSSLIDNTSDKVHNASSLARLDAMTSAARITFFVSLGIILGGAIIAYILVGENTKYQPFILGIAGLLILFALTRYLYETVKYVRQDPTKFYWNQPSNINALDQI